VDPSTLALIGLLSAFVGVLIGGIGIGGVLLVPMLAFVFGMDVHDAIAVAMFSYIFSGIVGATIYARRRSINWNMALWLFAGATPAAFAGAMAATVVPPRGLEFVIALFIVFAGVNALVTHGEHGDRQTALSPVSLIVIGTVTGFGSALTGTGGPLILVPILVWLKVPVLTAVGLSQAVQLPIATLATAGNFIGASVNMTVGAVLAVGLMAGAAVGARVAHAVSRATMRTVVAWVLVAVGIFIIVRMARVWLGL
jgi:uncharacterized membrane protein YfcA